VVRRCRPRIAWSAARCHTSVVLRLKLSFSLVLFAFGHLLGACAPGESFLAVELATDLDAGVDFVGVRVRLERGTTLLDETSELAALGESFLSPVRVGLFENLAQGTYSVHVELADSAGAVVAERTTIVELREDLALTVVVGAACRGVTCPGAGDSAEESTCADGRCVDPRCSPESPEHCGETCVSHADCDGGAMGTCVAGTCLYSVCNDGDPCDDGVFCNGLDTCGAGSCSIHGPPPCSADRCDEGTASCDTGCLTAADCPAEVIGDWSACSGFDDSCDQGAERSRTHVTFSCVSGMCESTMTTEMGSCTRVTEGDSCGARTCGAYGECRYPQCQTDGIQYRSCSDRECRSGACANVNSTNQERACGPRPSQEGQTCTDEFCQGVCRSGTCSEFCDYCGGACTLVGCRAGSCP